MATFPTACGSRQILLVHNIHHNSVLSKWIICTGRELYLCLFGSVGHMSTYICTLHIFNRVISEQLKSDIRKYFYRCVGRFAGLQAAFDVPTKVHTVIVHKCFIYHLHYLLIGLLPLHALLHFHRTLPRQLFDKHVQCFSQEEIKGGVFF